MRTFVTNVAPQDEIESPFEEADQNDPMLIKPMDFGSVPTNYDLIYGPDKMEPPKIHYKEPEPDYSGQADIEPDSQYDMIPKPMKW